MTGINKNILLICFFFGLTLFANAQMAHEDSTEFKLLKPRELRSFGNNAMRQGDYAAATAYFERFLQIRENNHKVAFKVAESYRLNRDYHNAKGWYGKAYAMSKNTYAPALYYHGLMMKMDGNCDSARVKFNAFRKQAGDDALSKALKKQVKSELAGCDSVVPMPPAKIAISHLDSTINLVHIEAAPLYLNDSTLIFSSLRTNKREFLVGGDTTNMPRRQLYKAVRVNNEWKYAGPFDGPFNAPGTNVSSASITSDGKRIYFTRCAKNWKDQMICGIYVSNLEDGKWGEPVSVNETVNHPEYTATQPAVGSTSKGQEVVYFASDRKGGRGGYDIWYFTYDAKKKVYSTPRNAGSKVNTAGEEMSPYYDQNTATLYFSSDSWPGMGGMDVFKSMGELKKFTVPQNVGQPVNSSYDDLFYTISSNRESGMVVSNRKGGASLKNPTCCDDLYEFKKLEFIKLKVEGIVFGGLDSVSKQPIQESMLDVYLIDPKNPEPVFVKSIPVDKDAKYEFVAEPESTYKLVGKKDGYLTHTVNVSTVGIKVSTTLKKDLLITKIPEVFRLENVYYEVDKHALTPNSRTAIDTTLLQLLFDNPEIKIEIGAHTDDQASDSYNINLSQKRAEGVVKYLISKGIHPDRLVAKGYGESQPIVPNLNPDGTPNVENRSRNRRTEFKVVGKVDLEIIETEDDDEEIKRRSKQD